MEQQDGMKRLQWETCVPIWRNRLVRHGLWLAVALPLGLAVAFLVDLQRGASGRSSAPAAAWLVGAAFAAVVLVLLTALAGCRFLLGFIVDEAGVTNYTQPEQVRNGSLSSILTMLLAPRSTAEVGFLAQSRQIVQIRWKDVTRSSYQSRRRTVLIRAGSGCRIALLCTPENYPQVESMVKHNLPQRVR